MYTINRRMIDLPECLVDDRQGFWCIEVVLERFNEGLCGCKKRHVIVFFTVIIIVERVVDLVSERRIISPIVEPCLCCR